MDVEKMKVFYDREIGLIVGVIDDDIMIIDHIDRSIVKHPLIFGRYDINSKDRILLRFGLLRYDEKWEPGDMDTPVCC